jgi:hypothetical protein
MEIKEDGYYPISEVQKIVGWSSRKLQRYAKKKNIDIIDNRYIFKGFQVNTIIKTNDNVATKYSDKQVKIIKDATNKDVINLNKKIENLTNQLVVLNKENAE